MHASVAPTANKLPAAMPAPVDAADEREIGVESDIGSMQAAEVRHLHPPQRHH